MNKALIKRQMKVATYAKKADTKTSFYLVNGGFPLPSRLSITFDNVITNSTHKGRMVAGDSVVGEIRGEFKKAEESPLKQNPPLQSKFQNIQKGRISATGWIWNNGNQQ